MQVRLTDIDSSLPNLALMKLAHWHKSQGHQVHLTKAIEPSMFEPKYDRVYASAIFKFSEKRTSRFIQQWPDAIIGGTGSPSLATVEQITGPNYDGYDYGIYPDFKDSIGFTQRGCRLSCKFCVVPTKEGKNRSVATISEIWRGSPYPKKIHLLDNDFFGQPREQWEARAEELRSGGFRVCLSQGINVRLINDEAATTLATLQYRDTRFKERRLYTAWDNIGDERIFFEGVERLAKAGIPPAHLRAYMLIGYAKGETWPQIWHRFKRMTDMGIEPYPMVYDRTRGDLISFQRWVNIGLYRIVPWPDYIRQTKTKESVAGWQQVYEGTL